MDSVMLGFNDLTQYALLILISVVGWGVRAVWSIVRRYDKKFDDFRAEIHVEMREYVQQATCRAHRDAIQRQFDDIQRQFDEIWRQLDEIRLFLGRPVEDIDDRS